MTFGFGFSVSRVMRTGGGAPPSPFDPDALAYITAVETADGQALEDGVRTAINDFVVGCKADGIWNAIRASCIMAGARTLSGALVPLVGPAPTNFNFVGADYNRRTGLKGNGTTKWLNTNRNYNADPLLSQHIAFRVAEQNTIATSVVFGVSGAVSNRTSIGAFGGFWNVRSRNNDPTNIAVSTTVGLIGVSRNLSTEHDARISGTTSNILARPAGAPGSENFGIFASGAGNFWSDMRCNFYSIGEHINLAQLENRVTALVNAIDEAIPVLDTLSVQSAAAYSLRKLRADYAGDAIRVRRSSDNAELDIGFTAEGDLDTVAMLDFVGLENRILHSQTFTTSWVANRASIVVDAALAPDGTMTATRLVEDNSPTNNHRLYSLGGSVPAGLPATVSFHAKAAERTQCFVRLTTNVGGSAGAYFDLLNGTVLSSQAGITASIQDLGDGWYRCAITHQLPGADPNAYIAPAVDGNEIYNGDGTSGILIWGAQNNTGTTAKTYVATTAGISGDGFVTTWYDQSGSDRNLTQSTAANQPRIVNAGVVETAGAKPTIRQTANATILIGPHASITGATAATAISVFSQSATQGAPFRISNSSGAPHVPFVDSNAYEAFMGATRTQHNGFGFTPSPLVYTVRHTGTEREVYKNGSQIGSGIATTINNPTSFTVPSNSVAATNPQLGISELVLTLNALSVNDRQTLERDQGTFYGITVA